MVSVHLEDGGIDLLPAAMLFRDDPDLVPEVEALALDLAAGRVLDAGAGAGAHSLRLQARGLEVTAVDVSPRAVAVMHARGVRDPRAVDLLAPGALAGERFDTVLMLMNGAGIAGDLAGLERLLDVCARLLRQDGQLLLDSADLRRGADPGERARIAARRRAGRYHGEVCFQTAYAGVVGRPFGWLFVDPARLRRVATRCGWQVQVVFESGDGSYLARLRRSA